jgi:hypothetical protein
MTPRESASFLPPPPSHPNQNTPALLPSKKHKRAHRLLERRSGMYDSSFFPLPAAAGDHLLPPFIAAAAAEYTGRVLLLRGMDTEACDAAEVARFLEVELGLKKIEAVVIHRELGAVVVAVHCTADAEALLKVPEKTWFMAFARAVECSLFFPTPPIPDVVPAAGMSDNNNFDLWRAIDPMVFQHVRLKFTDFLDDCSGDNLRGLIRGLGGLAAFSQPHDGLFGSNFTDRAVLLMGTDMYTEPALRQVLSRYGSLDGLALYSSRKAGKVGMAIYLQVLDCGIQAAAGAGCTPGDSLPPGTGCWVRRLDFKQDS